MVKSLKKCLLVSIFCIANSYAFKIIQDQNRLLIHMFKANECTEADYQYLSEYAENVTGISTITFVNTTKSGIEVGQTIINHLLEGFSKNKSGQLSVTSLLTDELKDEIQIANVQFKLEVERRKRVIHFQQYIPDSAAITT